MEALDAIRQDLQVAYARFVDRRRRRDRGLRMAAIAASGLLTAAAAAAGTARLLGWPAPGHVRAEIAAVDKGLPADLRLNPNVENARAVASTASSTLYAAMLKDGGYCTEIVTEGDRGRGATCTTGRALAGLPIEVTLPSDDSRTASSPVTLGGRVNAASARTLELRYGTGATDEVPLEAEGFFIFDVPSEHLAAAHNSTLTLVARAAGGAVVARATVPADWDGPAVPDEQAPLFVSTRSDESDLTKVYGVEGHVSAPGATSLELVYDDGATVPISIRAGGSYAYTVPADRVDDFMAPQTLIARNADGDVVARASVAAVAYWRGRERG